MPNIRSAVKRLKTTERQTKYNRSIKSAIKTSTTKTTKLAVENVEEAKISQNKSASLIDKAVKAGVLHPNTAARKKARLAKKVNSAQK